MDDSDSDADLADYAPSGLSQTSHTPDAAPEVTKKVLTPVKEIEAPSTPSEDCLKRGKLNWSHGTYMIAYISRYDPRIANSLPHSPAHPLARRFIDKIQVPDEITSTDQLAWHKYKWKKSVYLNPVRIGAKDMIIGLNMQQNFDESKRHAIEYLSCLKDTTGKRSVVPKSQLLPYGEASEWNPEFLAEYLETLKEAGKLTELELHKEELYLRKILKVVSARSTEHEEEKAPRKSLAFSYPNVESDMESEPEMEQRVSASPSVVDNHKKEPLKAGDAIEYYRTISKAGDKDALTQAIILSVRAGNAPLKLHNNEFLPAGHSVKRIFTRVRNSFVDLRSTATYRSIRSFKLAQSELKENDSMRQLLASTNSQLDAILERNFEAFEQKVKDAGCSEFMDIVSWKSKKTKSNGETMDQTPRKRPKLDTDVNASETLVDKDVGRKQTRL